MFWNRSITRLARLRGGGRPDVFAARRGKHRVDAALRAVETDKHPAAAAARGRSLLRRLAREHRVRADLGHAGHSHAAARAAAARAPDAARLPRPRATARRGDPRPPATAGDVQRSHRLVDAAVELAAPLPPGLPPGERTRRRAPPRSDRLDDLLTSPRSSETGA